MSARELFESHDWAYAREQVKSKSGDYLISDEIVYRDGHKKIVFDLIGKECMCIESGEIGAMNMEDIKLIQAQIKELGWL